MLTIEEWTDLARAVAACQERKTADYLTEHDLEDIAERYALEWDEATDGLCHARRVRRTSRLAPSRDTGRGFLFGHSVCRTRSALRPVNFSQRCTMTSQ